MKTARRWPDVALFMFLCAGSAFCTELHVAAAANLSNVLPQLSSAFEHKTSIHIVPSYGATAQLTQQIENGAPFDIFLSADTGHIDQLVKDGFVFSNSRAIYARGRVVVWAPRHPEIRTMNDLASSNIRTIAVATPALAPYGEAALDALRNAGLYDKVHPKLVYAPSISIAKQFADTGNAEAAFTALALIIGQNGNHFEVDEKLHKPIDQALGIVKQSRQQKAAHAFAAFLTSPEAREILHHFGYSVSPSSPSPTHSQLVLPAHSQLVLTSRDLTSPLGVPAREGVVSGGTR
jgi:molybdate transport system substrate-binding protein